MGNIEIFEEMAQQYDTEDRIRITGEISAVLRQRIGDAKGKTALDYGCGTGLVGLELADVFQSILLVDASRQMVRQVERKIEAAGLETAKALCLDLMAERPPELRADYVILVQVLLHIQEVASALSRLYSLLNEGGHLLIVDFNKEDSIVSDKVHNGFDQAELLHLVKSAGFPKATAETFYHGKAIFMGRDASLFLLDAVK